MFKKNIKDVCSKEFYNTITNIRSLKLQKELDISLKDTEQIMKYLQDDEDDDDDEDDVGFLYIKKGGNHHQKHINVNDDYNFEKGSYYINPTSLTY